jgi:transposase
VIPFPVERRITTREPHPIELRARVVVFVEEGNTHREAARYFRVSSRFVNNMVILKRVSGALKPARQGHLGGGKLTGHAEWVRARLTENGDLPPAASARA